MNNPSDMKKILFLAALALMFGACCNNKTVTFLHLSDPQIGFLDTTANYAQSDSLMGLAVEASLENWDKVSALPTKNRKRFSSAAWPRLTRRFRSSACPATTTNVPIRLKITPLS